MPWQRDAVDVMLEYDPATGLYRYGTIILTVPRQAGKTTLIGTLADHRCISRPNARAWITMQNGKTADSWMRNEHLPSLSRLGDPDSKRSPYRQSLRAGEIGPIWRRLNSTFFTFPPKRDALHSKQSDLAIISEAWAHSAEVGADIRQAIRPTMLTRRNAQLVVESTLGDDSSVFLDGYYDLGVESLTNPATRVCFIDYGIPDDADPEDLDVIAAHHPAFGHTVNMQALVDAREDFRADPALGGASGWARAYGNRATRSRETAIPASAWTTAARPRVDVPERAGVGLDATPSGARVAVGLGWRDDDQAFGELAYAGPPSRETPAMIVDLCRRNASPLVVDRGALGALELVDAVSRQRGAPEVVFLNMGEYAAACGVLYRGVLDDTWHHFNDPDLTAAAEIATKRDLGDGGFGWGRKTSAGSIAELGAVTVALKAADRLPARRRAVTVRTAKVA
jgi:hypothetical protein